MACAQLTGAADQAPDCQLPVVTEAKKQQQQREQQQQDEQFGTGREDLARFSWAQPTYTAVQPTNAFSFQM